MSSWMDSNWWPCLEEKGAYLWDIRLWSLSGLLLRAGKCVSLRPDEPGAIRWTDFEGSADSFPAATGCRRLRGGSRRRQSRRLGRSPWRRSRSPSSSLSPFCFWRFFQLLSFEKMSQTWIAFDGGLKIRSREMKLHFGPKQVGIPHLASRRCSNFGNF